MKSVNGKFNKKIDSIDYPKTKKENKKSELL